MDEGCVSKAEFDRRVGEPEAREEVEESTQKVSSVGKHEV